MNGVVSAIIIELNNQLCILTICQLVNKVYIIKNFLKTYFFF